jgi:hypothetical protein
MAAITLTEVKNANQLQYVSSLEAFNGDEPFTGREFAVPSGEMLFDVDGVLNSNSELIVYLRDDTIRGSQSSKKMSFIYKSSEHVDFPIQNGVFIEKFMFSEANHDDVYEDPDCECDESESACHCAGQRIMVHTLEIWLKNVAQELSMVKIRKYFDKNSDGSTPITFILPTGDVLIMKLFKYGYEPRINGFDDNAPKFISE